MAKKWLKNMSTRERADWIKENGVRKMAKRRLVNSCLICHEPVAREAGDVNKTELVVHRSEGACKWAHGKCVDQHATKVPPKRIPPPVPIGDAPNVVSHDQELHRKIDELTAMVRDLQTAWK